VVDIIRSNKCTRKSCLSGNQDNIEVIWYGKKYDIKESTCTSCVLRNDEVLSRLEPVALNMMPIRYIMTYVVVLCISLLKSIQHILSLKVLKSGYRNWLTPVKKNYC
jgi:hypothetical protein